MKFLAALVFVLPMSSFAAGFAACDLYAFNYSSTNNVDYKPTKAERISNTWKKLEGEKVTLQDRVYPVSYLVEFNSNGFITGSLGIKIDQPGPRVSGKSALNNGLQLEVEDTFNGGKVIYKLDCALDS